MRARSTEHGILMQAAMVRGLLREPTDPLCKRVTRRTSGVWARRQVGDLLWVRETFATSKIDDGAYRWEEVYYRATPREGLRRWLRRPVGDVQIPSQDLPHRITYLHPSSPLESGHASRVRRWTPSLLMPRWASRITLRITAIDAEPGWIPTRQDAEGAVLAGERLPGVTDAEARLEGVEDRGAYLRLWSEINGEDDPGVIWRIAFERVS